MRCLSLVLAHFLMIDCKRIPIVDSDDTLPYIAYEKNKKLVSLEWRDHDFLNLLHRNCIVEISSRGIRGIHKDTRKCNLGAIRANNFVAQSPCYTSKDSLCLIKNEENAGLNGACKKHSNNESALMSMVLPSLSKIQSDRDGEILVSGLLHADHHRMTNPVLNSFFRESKVSCRDKGKGRKHSIDCSGVYTVTACDVLSGKYALVFYPELELIAISHETFGSMAYFVMLVNCIICLYGISNAMYQDGAAEKQQQKSFHPQTAIACMNIASSSALIVLYVSHPDKFSFVVAEDEIVFVCTCILCIGYSALYFLIESQYNLDACIFNITSVCIAVYKACENPYIVFVVGFLIFRLWKSIFRNCRCQQEDQETFSVLHYAQHLMYLCEVCCFVEFGIKPQFESREEDWVIYSGLVTFVTFHVSILSNVFSDEK